MAVSINGYTLTGPLMCKNAGFSRWGFCQKDGREYFIKEFESPTYPPDDAALSPKIIERKRRICEAYYKEKKAFYDALSVCRSGNNILVEDFFRFGTRYYIVTDKVESEGWDPAIIACLSPEKKECFVRSLLYSVACLHRAGLVHADLKPENILLKPTCDGYYTAKIIDFDSGFPVGRVPEDIQGDYRYMAPEAFRRLHGEDTAVNEKADVFALGVLCHEYWTGRLPWFAGEHHYLPEAVLDGEAVALSAEIPLELRKQIERMLSRDPAARPGAREVLDSFRPPEVNTDTRLKVSGFKTRETPLPTPAVPTPAPDVKKTHGFYVPTDLG